MATKYISLEAAIKRRHGCQKDCSICDFAIDGDSWCQGDVFVVDILRVPAADVVDVRHGRWIDEKGNAVEWDPVNKNCPKSSCYCSECKEWLTASDEYPVIGLYCPNCGAKMTEV